MSGISMGASLFQTDGPTEFTGLADGKVTLPANLGEYLASHQLMLHFLLLEKQHCTQSATWPNCKQLVKEPRSDFLGNAFRENMAVGIVLNKRWAFH